MIGLSFVVGIGDVVDLGLVERAAHRALHHIVSLRLVLAANVLEHTDVAIGDEHLVGLRQRCQHVRAVVSGGAFGGVIGRSGVQNRRVAR